MMATKGNRYAWKHDRQTWTCATHSLCGGTFVACEGDQASRDSEQPHLVPGLICEDSRVAGPRSPSGWLPGPPRAGSSGNLLAPKVLLRSHRSTPDRHVGGRSRGPG